MGTLQVYTLTCSRSVSNDVEILGNFLSFADAESAAKHDYFKWTFSFAEPVWEHYDDTCWVWESNEDEPDSYFIKRIDARCSAEQLLRAFTTDNT